MKRVLFLRLFAIFFLSFFSSTLSTPVTLSLLVSTSYARHYGPKSAMNTYPSWDWT